MNMTDTNEIASKPNTTGSNMTGSNMTGSKLDILMYGETGTGKSIRAASAAVFGKVFIFDFDLKFDSIKHYYNDKPEILENVSYESYADNLETPNACTRAYQKLKDIWKQVASGTCPYDTIVWDSWTEWEQMNLRQIMATNPGFKRMKANIGIGTVTVPDQADYRIHAHLQQTFLPQLLSLPLNVIVICHIATRVDEITGGIERGVAAAGKLMKVMPKYFGETHRAFVDPSGAYRIQVRGNHQFTAKTCMKNIPQDGILTPDLEPFRYMAKTHTSQAKHTSDSQTNKENPK